MNRSKKKFVVAFLFVTLGFYSFYFFRIPETTSQNSWNFSCSMEFVQDGNFVENGVEFLNGYTQSAEFAKSGLYSSKLDSNTKFGATVTLDSINPGQSIFISCWVKGGYGKAVLCAKGSGRFKLYKDNTWAYDNIETAYKVIDSTSWYQVKLKVLVVGDFANQQMTIYAIHPDGAGPVYFDDLNIVRIDGSDKDIPKYSDENIQQLSLKIDSNYYEKMRLKRQEAFNTGILLNDIGRGKGELQINSKKYKVEVRLKGDYPDHLEGIKWSLRVKSKNNCNQLKEYSLQAPHTRHFLDEWVLHKVMRQEGVLAPKYDFVNLMVNNKHLGVFAREEHFTKQFIKNSRRPSGPILKFSEDELWDFRSINNGNDYSGVPLFMAAPIKPFRFKKIKKDSIQMNQYLVAQNLMHQFRHGLRTPSEIFDLDKLAKYYALTEIFKATHGRVWHNMRFYYNPTLKKLEPICYDGYVDLGVSNGNDDLIYSKGELSNEVAVIFNDLEFQKLFRSYTVMYSDETWFEAFFKENNDEIKRLERLISSEYSGYKYNWDFIPGNAIQLKMSLSDTIKQFKVVETPDNRKKEEFILIKNISTVGYRPDGSLSTTLFNFHNREVQIYAYGVDSTEVKLPTVHSIQGYSGHGVSKQANINVPEEFTSVFYKTKSGKKGRSKILNQPPPFVNQNN